MYNKTWFLAVTDMQHCLLKIILPDAYYPSCAVLCSLQANIFIYHIFRLDRGHLTTIHIFK